MQVDGYSLDAQRDKLRKYAAYEDMVVAGEYSDEGFSGKNIQGRQEFQRMLNDIQDCKDGVSYVLVFKLSRFGRNAADVLNSLQLMQDFGVNLICVEDGIDSSKDAGKLMISVLSAVAEIERENIRTQTMAGREQKAREGKWNGGFAPYGYKLENGNLVIAEDEVEVIRVIYDRYIHTNEGVAGVAKYLNRNGYVKKLRQNNTIPGFSRDFVKNVLYNPVYMGKIAYGRRRTEKKQGTRNEIHVVEQSEFPVYEGQHEAIISEEDWYLAQEKRKINSFKREKVNNPDHAHILSGILKCPCCGKSMYGNIAKAHSKDKKTRYYYYCKNTVTPTGHECSFRLNIEQTEINKFVAKIISAMVNNPRFVEAIQAKIGTAVDTEDMEKQIAVLQGQLKQAFGTKSRLERQMDTLDINDAHYDRKILDLQRRYDEQYDTIEEIEVQIGELQSQIRSIQQEKISGDNIYRLLLAFDEVYHSATEAEQKEFMKAFIERIEMFPEKRKDGSWIKKIVFNFPVPVDGEEVKELPLETETTVEAVTALDGLHDGFLTGGGIGHAEHAIADARHGDAVVQGDKIVVHAEISFFLLLFHPGRGAADDERRQDQNSSDEQAERVDQHQGLEVCMAGEHRLHPENADAADAQRRQDGRGQRNAEAPQITRHQFIQQAEQVAGEDDGQAGIAQCNDLRVAVEQRQQRVSEIEHNAHNGHSDQYIFQQAEGEGLAAAVELPGTVVLPHEGGTGLTERVKGIIGDDLNVECCTGCRNHHGAEAVDGRLHNDVGKGKHGALDAGRQADLDDLAEAGMVKLQGVGAHANGHIRMGQAVEQQQ